MIKNLISLVLDVYSFLLLIRIVFSFFAMTSGTPYQGKFFDVLKKVTDPPLIPFQRMIGNVQIGNMFLDFAPLVLLFLINIIQSLFL